MQAGGKQTAARQGGARKSNGTDSLCAKKACLQLKMASVKDTHAVIHFGPNSRCGAKEMVSYSQQF